MQVPVAEMTPDDTLLAAEIERRSNPADGRKASPLYLKYILKNAGTVKFELAGGSKIIWGVLSMVTACHRDSKTEIDHRNLDLSNGLRLAEG